ncbi:MAG: hypothetical protein V4590_14640 [Bacteroidota bacterium]
MEYRVTIRNQFKSLEFLIYGSLFFAILVYILYQNEGYSADLLQFFSVYYLVLLIPTLFLHIEYYLKNKNDILTIDTCQELISINEQRPISFNEIEKITFFMPPVWHRKGIIRLLPFEDYHYAKIKMKNGEYFVFTCLMAYRVEEALELISGVVIEKKTRLFATTLLE